MRYDQGDEYEHLGGVYTGQAWPANQIELCHKVLPSLTKDEFELPL